MGRRPVKSRWVLTARHCVDNGGPDDVRIGDVRRGHGTRVTVDRIAGTRNADLALLRLSRPGSTSYAPLASADPPAGHAWPYSTSGVT